MSLLLHLPLDDRLFVMNLRKGWVTDNGRNANSASNALNKWIHANFRNDIVIHGFRHAMRHRLRAVNCPSEMIDQIGGWSSGKIGEGYGEGYSVLQTTQWMTRLQFNQNQGRTS